MDTAITPAELANKLQGTSRVLSAKNIFPEMRDLCEVGNEALGMLMLADRTFEQQACSTSDDLSKKIGESFFKQPSQVIDAFAEHRIWAIPAPDNNVALVYRVHSRDDYNDLPYHLVPYIKTEWRPCLVVLQVEIFRLDGDTEARACMSWAAMALTKFGPKPIILSPEFAVTKFPELALAKASGGESNQTSLSGRVAGVFDALKNHLGGKKETFAPIEECAISSLKPSLHAITENALVRALKVAA